MKLNKKVMSLSLVAALASSSVALAAWQPTDGMTNVDGAPISGSVEPGFNDNTAPVPVYTGSNSLAYNQAKTLYEGTFYYEAHVALAPVVALAEAGALSMYDATVVFDFNRMIEKAIDRVIIEEAFADVEAFMKNGYYAEAKDILINDVFSLALYQPTASALTGATTNASEQLYYDDSFTIEDWSRARALEAKISAVVGDVIHSKDAAAARVTWMYGELPEGAWYYVAEVGNRYDVYVNYTLGDGTVITLGEVDICKNGTILLDTMPGIPDSPWNNPITE